VVGPVAVVSLLWPLGLVVHDGRADVFWPLWFLFLLGALTYWTWQRRIPPIAFAVYTGALAVGVGTGPYGAVTVVGLGTVAVLGAAAEWGRLDRWLADRVSQFLGRISYSLYLVHTPVLGAALVVMLPGEGSASPVVSWVALVAGLAASIIAATLFHLVVEVPSIRYARAVGRRQPTEPVTPYPATGSGSMVPDVPRA
jgi:peptidoglycan/LPS O-acetylase OafA/YrhL